MAQKQKSHQPKKPALTAERIADTLLLLADKSGWKDLSLSLLAKQLKTTEAAIQDHFASVTDILIFILRSVEDETAETIAPYLTESWRDNIMELLMARFDIANRNRRAFETLPQFLKGHPSAVSKMAPVFYETMSRMLDTARYENKNPLIIAAFGVLYISVVDVWSKDKAADMPKTMSAIDKRLGHFDSFAKYAACRKD